MAKVQVKVKVNTSLNYRTGPSTSYKILGTVTNGQTFTSSKQQNKWYYLDEKKGWASGAYLTVTKNLGTTSTTKTVSQPVASNPGKNTVSATQAGTSIGIDGKVLQMILNSVKSKTKKIDASMRLFGQPHQFTRQVDFRPAGGGYDLGRKFMESVVSESPIVYFMPGRPNFLPNISDKERSAMKEFFGKMKSDNADNKSALDAILKNKDVRYFDFIADYATYIRYVNLLCRAAAIFMGVGDEEAPIQSHRKKYKWFDWSNWHYAESFVPKDSKKQSIFDLSKIQNDIVKGLMGDWQYVQFYADPRTSFQESSSNSTAESKLANMVQSGSQAMKEAQFMLQTGGMGNGAQWIADSQGAWQDAIGKFGTDGILKRMGDISSTVISGANVVFPEIWGNSAYNKSYNITINLTSPYGDRRSIYLNVIVPLMHLMALALPRQTSANSFTTPFIVKVSSKGWFSCEMGMIDNISIEKVVGSYNVDGLPTEVKVNISIKDLYSTLMMTNNAEPMMFFENKGLMNWLAVTCGMDITKPHFEEQWEAMLMTLFNSIVDIPGDIANSILEGLKNAVDNIWK